jgi:opacity protein-like surface antigen
MDLGRYRITRSLVAPAIGTGDISLKSSGWFADAVGFRALSPTWSLFGKLGAMYTTTEATLTPSGAVLLPAGTDLNPKRSEWNFKFGFGAQYAFSKDMALRFGYDQVSSVGDANTGQGDVRLFSLGLRIGF